MYPNLYSTKNPLEVMRNQRVILFRKMGVSKNINNR
jgi:hypothetical protein